MSLSGRKKNVKKKNLNSISIDRVNELEKKISQLKPQNIQYLENKISRLEQKNQKLENSMKEIKKIKPTSMNKEVKLLNNVINKDLNEIKIKIEKNESIIKKILFN